MNNENYKNIFEEKRINKKFLISNDKYRICYTPKGDTKKLSILLNYHITKFGPILKQIIELKKYDTIKIFTKSIFIDEDKTKNDDLLNCLIVDDYCYQIFDLEAIRSSQEKAYSLFCRIEKK